MSIIGDTENSSHSPLTSLVRHIVVGWLIVQRLHPNLRQAVEGGRALMLEHLPRVFTEFEWRMPIVQRHQSLRSDSEEPVLLLDDGVQERDIHHWDYALVITQADLRSYYKP